jgi:hypothetical protein
MATAHAPANRHFRMARPPVIENLSEFVGGIATGGA